MIDLTFISHSAGYLAGYLLGFWYLYLIVMGLYRAHLAKRLSKFALVLGAPAIAVGLVVDVLAQYTIASVFFKELPRKGEHLVTDRLQRYMKQETGWRYAKAKALCEHLLAPFDPTWRHC